MLHEASLVHDDICDGSVIRRGAPSLAAAYGVRFAAFAGVHLAALAIDLLAEIMDRVSDAWTATLDDGTDPVHLSQLTLGQLLERLPPPITDLTALRQHYRTVAAAKTGTLFRIACLTGGVLAGCGGGQLRLLAGYADHLGFAFQVMDDVRDLADSGRPAGTDVRRGVPSWPVIEWLAIREDAAPVWHEPGRGLPSSVSPSAICAAVIDSGATDLARRTAEREARLALHALHAFPDTAGRRHLADLCTRIAANQP
jgi:geranylgeranyl pyrophosphate synthase